MTKNIPAIVVISALVLGTAITVWQGSTASAPDSVMVEVQVPELSLKAQRGQVAFEATCAACHGQAAGGTRQGPPLVHDYYNPGHHADEAFRRAVRFGVRRHHWPYGDMPKQPHVSAGEIEAIIAFVRELQAANGIVSRPHSM